MCHNNPQNNQMVNSKSTPEKSTLPRKVNTEQQQVKFNAAWSMVNLWPLFLCQNVQTSEIEVYAKNQLLLTMRWPKSTLVKPAVETLAAAEISSSFFPTREQRIASKELEPIRRGERMCEDEMSEKSSNVDLIYIH